MFHDLTSHVSHMVLDTLRMLRPYRATSASKIRIGRYFDGGYVMLDDFDDIDAAYSLGINDDVSWDLDMARRGISVHQYDHTIASLPRSHPLFHWEPKCIGGIADAAAGIETLENLIGKNKHADKTNMLLKCDIEGSEWQLLEHTPNRVLRQFRQIVIELHNMAFLAAWHDANNVRAALVNLTTSHHVVHVHGNNFAPWAVVGGVPVPSVLELTLVRKDFGLFTPSDETFPTSMDMPCNAALADLYLGRFAFD